MAKQLFGFGLGLVMVIGSLGGCRDAAYANGDGGGDASDDAAAPMIASDVVEAPSARATGSSASRVELGAIDGSEASDAFARVIDDDGVRLVLAENPSEQVAEAWSMRRPVLVARAPTWMVRREVDERALPQGLSRWAGRRVELMSGDRVVCEATLSGYELVGRVDADYDEIGRWEGVPEEHTAPEPLAQIEDEVWASSADSGRVLTISVRDTSGHCEGATWARVASTAAASIAVVGDSDDALRAAALTELRRLPAFAEAQHDYEVAMREEAAAANDDGMPGAAATPPTNWDESEGSVATVRSVRRPDRETIVVWAAIEHYDGCGGFGASVSAVFEVTTRTSGQFVFRQVAEGEEIPTVTPEFVADLDGDGVVEWVPAYEPPIRPYHGCSC